MFFLDRITRIVGKPFLKLWPIILFGLMLVVAGCNFNADQPTTGPLPTIQPVIVVTATPVVVPGATTQPGAPGVITPTTAPAAVGPTQAVGSTLAVNSANAANPANAAQSGCTPKANWVAYQVQAGDTLGVLAARTNSTTADLVSGNCLTNPDKIDVGQTIYLPQAPANTTAVPPTQVPAGSGGS